MAAVQVDTTAADLVPASDVAQRKILIQNLGPNSIFLDIGAVATATTGIVIAASGANTFTVAPGKAISAITTVLQVSPSDTRWESV